MACSVVCVSDGAGSAKRGGEGSKEAVYSALDFATNKIASAEQDFRQFFTDLFRTALAHLQEVADQAGSPVQDYACTLIVAVLIGRRGYFAQIGDGALVVEIEGEGFECETWPAQGEFAGETVFLTTDGAIEAAQIIREERSITFFAAFTDGMQSLALHYASNSAYTPFFLHLKKGLEQVSHSDDELMVSLADFLKSDPVNERTDDDKTLVVGTWVHDAAGESD